MDTCACCMRVSGKHWFWAPAPPRRVHAPASSPVRRGRWWRCFLPTHRLSWQSREPLWHLSTSLPVAIVAAWAAMCLSQSGTAHGTSVWLGEPGAGVRGTCEHHAQEGQAGKGRFSVCRDYCPRPPRAKCHMLVNASWNSSIASGCHPMRGCPSWWGPGVAGWAPRARVGLARMWLLRQGLPHSRWWWQEGNPWQACLGRRPLLPAECLLPARNVLSATQAS